GGGGPPHYEPPKRGRSLWPWLVGAGILLALLTGAWLARNAIEDQLQGSETVAVPYVVGIPQANAESLIQNAGLIPQVRRVSNSDVPEGTVFAQKPTEGTKVDKQTVVRIDVSSGKPQVTIPSVVGQSIQDAVA